MRGRGYQQPILEVHRRRDARESLRRLLSPCQVIERVLRRRRLDQAGTLLSTLMQSGASCTERLRVMEPMPAPTLRFVCSAPSRSAWKPMQMSAPARAQRVAMTRPMPGSAPVTMASPPCGSWCRPWLLRRERGRAAGGARKRQLPAWLRMHPDPADGPRRKQGRRVPRPSGGDFALDARHEAPRTAPIAGISETVAGY